MQIVDLEAEEPHDDVDAFKGIAIDGEAEVLAEVDGDDMAGCCWHTTRVVH